MYYSLLITCREADRIERAKRVIVAGEGTSPQRGLYEFCAE